MEGPGKNSKYKQGVTIQQMIEEKSDESRSLLMFCINVQLINIINVLDFAGHIQCLTLILRIYESMYPFKNVKGVPGSQGHAKTGRKPNLTHGAQFFIRTKTNPSSRYTERTHENTFLYL